MHASAERVAGSRERAAVTFGVTPELQGGRSLSCTGRTRTVLCPGDVHPDRTPRTRNRVIDA
jgi:hypothetical protein